MSEIKWNVGDYASLDGELCIILASDQNGSQVIIGAETKSIETARLAELNDEQKACVAAVIKDAIFRNQSLVDDWRNGA